jgi:hypothetical protein
MRLDLNTFLSVILGAAIAFLSQFLLSIMQRKWNLDDQRREWKRSILTSIHQQYEEINEISLLFSSFRNEVAYDNLRVELTKKMNKINQWDDENLNVLQNSYSILLSELLFAPFSSENINNIPNSLAGALGGKYVEIGAKLSTKYNEIKSRINQLIENTYN